MMTREKAVQEVGNPSLQMGVCQALQDICMYVHDYADQSLVFDV